MKKLVGVLSLLVVLLVALPAFARIEAQPVYSGDAVIVQYEAIEVPDALIASAGPITGPLTTDTSGVPAFTEDDLNKLLGPNEADPVALAKDAFAGYSTKNWEKLAAAVLALTVWAVRAYLIKSIPANYLKHVAMGLAVVGSVATSLSSGADPLSATFTGIGMGLMAIGAWEYVGKPIHTKFGKPPAPGS